MISPHRWAAWLRCQKWSALYTRNCRAFGTDNGFEMTPEIGWGTHFMGKAW
jgi:hypothetical protein